MIIKAINIGIIPNETQQRFESVQCVSSLYLKQLGKFENGVCTYLEIYFTEKIEDNGKLERVQNFCHYYKFFSYNDYIKLSDSYSKKALLTKYLNQAILELCDITEWEKDIFIETFARCQELDFKNEWFFKNKLFPSPDKQFYVGLYHVYDINKFEIYEVLFDKDKNEIARRVCFKDNIAIFRIDQLYWDKNSEIFNYKFKTPTKVFSTNVHEIIKGESLALPSNTSSYFK